MFLERLSAFEGDADGARFWGRGDPAQRGEAPVEVYSEGACEVRPALGPVGTLTCELEVDDAGSQGRWDSVLCEPLGASRGEDEGFSRSRDEVALTLKGIGNGDAEPTGEMRVAGARVPEGSELVCGTGNGQRLVRGGGQDEERFDGVGHFLVGEFVVAVATVRRGFDEAGFGEAAEVFAGGLWCDVGGQGEFAGGDGAASHELEEHGGPGGFGD